MTYMIFQYRTRTMLSFCLPLLVMSVCNSRQEWQDASTTERTRITTATPESKFDAQTQIYIISGTVGGLVFLIMLLVWRLAGTTSNIQRHVNEFQELFREIQQRHRQRMASQFRNLYSESQTNQNSVAAVDACDEIKEENEDSWTTANKKRQEIEDSGINHNISSVYSQWKK